MRDSGIANIGLVEELAKSHALNESSRLLTQVAQSLGFTWVSATFDLSDTEVIVDEDGIRLVESMGCPLDILDDWESKGYNLLNPVNIICRGSRDPFYWTDDEEWSIALDIKRPQRMVLDSVFGLGVRGAITVPVCTAPGKIGQVTWASCQMVHWADRLASCRWTLVLASEIFMSIVRKKLRIGERDAIVSFTAREQECLSWAACGKSDIEIGIILGISYATVRFHLSNACKKIGGRTRGQAIARASQLGWIRELH